MTFNQKINKGLIALLVFWALLITSCNKGIMFSKYRHFEKNEWFAKDKLLFEVNVSNGDDLNDISLMIRHADAYPYSNLFLFLTTQYPDGKVVTDTLECLLANNKGEWQGDGAGDIFDISIPLKKNVRFPLTGKYIFTFEQAMRTNPLPYIMDFGMEIKKSKGN